MFIGTTLRKKNNNKSGLAEIEIQKVGWSSNSKMLFSDTQ